MQVNPGLKVVVLIGSSLANKNTLATLIGENINVVGAVMADQKKKGINFKFLRIALKKQGPVTVLLQILERLLYKLLNHRRDGALSKAIFDHEKIHKTLEGWEGEIHRTASYSDAETLRWVRNKKPDLIVIHTPYWVGKKMRDIVGGTVIGGHPGITQFYRGVHSPFWAVYKNDLDNIGFSVFWVDSGVDTGDLIHQGKISPQSGDTYVSLSWRGMVEIASTIARTLKAVDQIDEIPRAKNQNIDENGIYYHPTIFQYIKYRLKQNKVK